MEKYSGCGSEDVLGPFPRPSFSTGPPLPHHEDFEKVSSSRTPLRWVLPWPPAPFSLVMLDSWFGIIEFFCCCSFLSRVRLFVTPWTAAWQASLSITNFRSLLKLMSIESVKSSHHLILCCSLLLLSSIFPCIRVFSSASGGQSYGVWASASILPMNVQGWFPLGVTDLISLQSKGLSPWTNPVHLMLLVLLLGFLLQRWVVERMLWILFFQDVCSGYARLRWSTLSCGWSRVLWTSGAITRVAHFSCVSILKTLTGICSWLTALLHDTSRGWSKITKWSSAWLYSQTAPPLNSGFAVLRLCVILSCYFPKPQFPCL